jgi:hypothetical protein
LARTFNELAELFASGNGKLYFFHAYRKIRKFSADSLARESPCGRSHTKANNFSLEISVSGAKHKAKAADKEE